MQREVAFLGAVVPVYEDIQLIEQSIHRRIFLRSQFLKCVACVAPHIETSRVCAACEREQCRRLQEGLTAAECESREERIFVDLREHRTDGCHAAADERLRVGVVTAGAAARTALCKDRQPYALTVYDGVPRNP